MESKQTAQGGQRKRIVILQEYVPAYRVPLFKGLRREAERADVHLEIAAGRPSRQQRLRGDAVRMEGVSFFPQWSMSIFGRRLTVRLAARAYRGADLVVLEHARRNLDGYRLVLPRGRKTQRIALWGHGRDYVQSPSRFGRWLLALLARKADWYFAYTSSGAVAVQGYGVPAERVTVVGNTIDSGALQKELNSISDGELREYRLQHNLSEHTAIFIGGLDASKRLTFLLEAGSLIARELPAFRLIVVGDGEQRRLVETYDAPWVHFVGPQRGRGKAIALACAELIMMPGRVGLIAVDSFAAQTPIATTQHESHGPEFDYLSDGVNAVITPATPSAYAEGVLRILTDAEWRGHLQDGCRQSGAGLDMEAMVRRMWSGLEKAIS